MKTPASGAAGAMIRTDKKYMVSSKRRQARDTCNGCWRYRQALEFGRHGSALLEHFWIEIAWSSVRSPKPPIRPRRALLRSAAGLGPAKAPLSQSRPSIPHKGGRPRTLVLVIHIWAGEGSAFAKSVLDPPRSLAARGGRPKIFHGVSTGVPRAGEENLCSAVFRSRAADSIESKTAPEKQAPAKRGAYKKKAA